MRRPPPLTARTAPIRTERRASGALLAGLDDERRRDRRRVVDAELVERLDAEVRPGRARSAGRRPCGGRRRSGRSAPPSPMPTAANGWAIASTNGAPGLSTRWTWRSVRPRSWSSSRRVVGEHDVDRAARREAEVGQLAVVALDGHPRRGGRRPQVGDALGVGVEGDRLGARLGEGDGLPAMPSSTTRRPPATSPSRCSSSSPGDARRRRSRSAHGRRQCAVRRCGQSWGSAPLGGGTVRTTGGAAG